MKTCLNCENIVVSIKSYTKYCSHSCCTHFQRKKRVEQIRVSPELREKKNNYERIRRSKVGRKRDRLKHNEEEKERYRKKFNIKSDQDLKVKPRGCGTITIHGYRQITKKEHPNANRAGTMFEHVFVMSNFLKRPLVKGENVHHINGIRHDNRIENLELWSTSQPPGQRVNDKLKWCKEFLEQYGHTVIMEINGLVLKAPKI